MCGAISWCTQNYAEICDKLRELMGSGIFLMPANMSFLGNPELRETFDAYWSTATCSALDRMKLFRLAWDLLGSEFAARHVQSKNFYPGPTSAVRAPTFPDAPCHPSTAS